MNLKPNEFFIDHMTEDGWMTINDGIYKSKKLALDAAFEMIRMSPDRELRIRDYLGGAVWTSKEMER